MSFTAPALDYTIGRGCNVLKINAVTLQFNYTHIGFGIVIQKVFNGKSRADIGYYLLKTKLKKKITNKRNNCLFTAHFRKRNRTSAYCLLL